jgi:tRNA A-37 threonylcarbamoyl transferase component Bud32
MGDGVAAEPRGQGQAPPARSQSGRKLRMGFVLDVAGYGARSAPLQNEVQQRLPPLVINSLAECEMDLDHVGHEWTGDGINAVMPADMDPTVVLPVLIRSLAANLRADNARTLDRIRLRMAIGVGLVEHNRAGFGGPMIIDINRLVDSTPLRAALSAYPTADLAVAITDQVHATVIRPGYPGIPEGQFNRVEVVAKEFSGRAWIWVSARQWSEPAYQALTRDDPREIAGYRIAARLGESPAGQVYLGSSRNGSWRAVKVFRRELAADPEVRHRLAAGVLTASVPRGEHIAQVIESDTESDRPWVAGTLVRGPALRSVVAETGPLAANFMAWVALGAARALVPLHQAGLAHQAISPDNVLLDTSGPVLTDLALSKAALTGESAATEDDVFMLACVTCFAAVGQAPWGGICPASPAFDPRTAGEPDLTGFPSALLPIVMPCLDPDPAQRPTAAELAARLAEIATQPSRSWLPEAVAARFADYQQFPASPPAHRRRFPYLRSR